MSFRAIALAAIGAIGLLATAAPAMAEWHGGPGYHGGPVWHGGPGWHGGWRGGYGYGYYGPRVVVAPPPVVFAAPRVYVAPPPVVYAAPPPVYYSPY
jgi:hypothetical protein